MGLSQCRRWGSQFPDRYLRSALQTPRSPGRALPQLWTGFGQLEKLTVAPRRGPRAIEHRLRGSPAPRATQDCETLQITFSRHSQNQLLPCETSVFQKSMTKPPLCCQTGLTARQFLLLSLACLFPLLKRVSIAELK